MEAALTELNHSLLRKYVAYTVVAGLETVASETVNALSRAGHIGEEAAVYLGWVDVVYIGVFFFCGFVFSHVMLGPLMARVERCGQGKEPALGRGVVAEM
eukprot:gnl/Chilomastix_caulleri/4197.p2 GENE.gnl/Chilomastix_caulleri/4197~~gnl/Chilomastix_caulleri/4197.p2  ORF type:complete len:100 (+),score=16.01 gnl/Chilomastix_caulleri/4197:1-300(+)